MEILDLTDGTKYRVITVTKMDLLTIAALHEGVRSKGMEALSNELADKLSSAKNFNDVKKFMEDAETTVKASQVIDQLLVGMIKVMDKIGVQDNVRMLVTVPELEYFTHLAQAPVNMDKARAAGYDEEQIKHADDIIEDARKALAANEAPTQEDIKKLILNNEKLTGNIFNPPVGKA